MPPGEGGRITIGVTVSASWDSWLVERILDRDCDTLVASPDYSVVLFHFSSQSGICGR